MTITKPGICGVMLPGLHLIEQDVGCHEDGVGQKARANLFRVLHAGEGGWGGCMHRACTASQQDGWQPWGRPSTTADCRVRDTCRVPGRAGILCQLTQDGADTSTAYSCGMHWMAPSSEPGACDEKACAYEQSNHLPCMCSSQPALTRLLLFSLNCTILRSHPMGVWQLSSQASSAWAGTWLCTNTLARSGSTPQARYSAAEFRVASLRSVGLWGRVMACRSTTQK